MASLADSSAFLDPGRQLAQHQAALTLLQGMLADPSCGQLAWLDLACGRGQIIAHLNRNLSSNERGKIRLVGYDIENSHSKQAKKTAEGMQLASCAFEVGALDRFWENRATDGPWQFITLTNTAHEIVPVKLAEIVARCIERLAADGCIFLYDMERLPVPELGAVPWSAAEMKSVLSVLCHSLGAESFEPSVGEWTHFSCTGWNAQIRRQHLQLPNDFTDRMDSAIESTGAHVSELLRERLGRADAALEILAEHGAETKEEVDEKEVLLYEFWAVSRALRNNR